MLEMYTSKQLLETLLIKTVRNEKKKTSCFFRTVDDELKLTVKLNGFFTSWRTFHVFNKNILQALEYKEKTIRGM